MRHLVGEQVDRNRAGSYKGMPNLLFGRTKSMHSHCSGTYIGSFYEPWARNADNATVRAYIEAYMASQVSDTADVSPHHVALIAGEVRRIAEFGDEGWIQLL